MKHEIFKIMVILLCGLSIFPSPAQAKYGGGSGEPNDPFLIYTAEQMNAIGADSNDWDKHFLLCADIDLSGYTGTSFNIIGYWVYWDSPDNKPFTGIFDGNGHTILNCTCDSNDRDYIGLFGYVDDPNAEIKDLGLICPNVYAGSGDYIGSLVGLLSSGTITNCYVEGGSVSGEYCVGGLVGENNYGTISNCYATATVSGSFFIGGLVGYNESGTISNCYSAASVSEDRFVGGLVGYNYSGTITNCYSAGSVSGNEDIGGLVGGNHGTITNCYSTGSVVGNNLIGGLVGENYGTITNCYSTGSVAGISIVGGLMGYNERGMISGSFWDIDTSGRINMCGGQGEYGSGCDDDNGKTTAEMQTASTFLAWGCELVWTIDEGNDYPRLWWENEPGELITTPSYGGGNGEPNDPYLIYTAEQFIGLITCDLDRNFKLMADIDLAGFTGKSFNIIGTHWTNPFTGVFDGSGHTISNFTYTSTNTNCIGLFGFVRGVIKDLGLIDPNVDAGTGWFVGSLVGCLKDGTITNCYVGGSSVSGDRYVGGLVGENYGTITNCSSTGSVSGKSSVGSLMGSNSHGTITDCHAGGSVSGKSSVGGLVGRNYESTILNCYSAASVSGKSSVGGLVGYNSEGVITNCYSTGSITGNGYVGGLLGGNGYDGIITNCYAISTVTGGSYAGGLVGANEGYCDPGPGGACFYGIISNCYSTGSVSGNYRVGGLMGSGGSGAYNSFWDIETSGRTRSYGGLGKTTAEMQTMSTFTDAGWDFVGESVNGIEDIWFIPQWDYPHLWWEGMQVPMKLTPRTLNCRSKGNWVKAHLTLPEGFTVEDVDSGRPAVLHSLGFQSAPLGVFINENELVEIEAAFERQAVCSLAGNWPQDLTVAGFFADGNIFLGTSTVRIIHPGMKVIEDLATYWLNTDCYHPDFCNGIDMNRDSIVNLLDYALLMNAKVEFVTDE